MVVLAAAMSRTNTSGLVPLRSTATRLVAVEVNTTLLASADSDGLVLSALAWAPEPDTDTMVVVPAAMSRTNTSRPPVSPATRSEAVESKAT